MRVAPMPDHPHTIDRWDDATGENLIEQIAAVGDYLVALETYRAAVKRWPKDKITLMMDTLGQLGVVRSSESAVLLAEDLTLRQLEQERGSYFVILSVCR